MVDQNSIDNITSLKEMLKNKHLFSIVEIREEKLLYKLIKNQSQMKIKQIKMVIKQLLVIRLKKRQINKLLSLKKKIKMGKMELMEQIND